MNSLDIVILESFSSMTEQLNERFFMGGMQEFIYSYKNAQ